MLCRESKMSDDGERVTIINREIKEHKSSICTSVGQCVHKNCRKQWGSVNCIKADTRNWSM